MTMQFNGCATWDYDLFGDPVFRDPVGYARFYAETSLEEIAWDNYAAAKKFQNNVATWSMINDLFRDLATAALESTTDVEDADNYWYLWIEDLKLSDLEDEDNFEEICLEAISEICGMIRGTRPSIFGGGDAYDEFIHKYRNHLMEKGN